MSLIVRAFGVRTKSCTRSESHTQALIDRVDWARVSCPTANHKSDAAQLLPYRCIRKLLSVNNHLLNAGRKQRQRNEKSAAGMLGCSCWFAASLHCCVTCCRLYADLVLHTNTRTPAHVTYRAGILQKGCGDHAEQCHDYWCHPVHSCVCQLDMEPCARVFLDTTRQVLAPSAARDSLQALLARASWASVLVCTVTALMRGRPHS